MTKEFYLPESIDTEGVTSRYENGVLSVALPLRQQAGPRAVSIE
jgi:HSP20 family molecular chaperone IbpA